MTVTVKTQLKNSNKQAQQNKPQNMHCYTLNQPQIKQSQLIQPQNNNIRMCMYRNKR